MSLPRFHVEEITEPPETSQEHSFTGRTVWNAVLHLSVLGFALNIPSVGETHGKTTSFWMLGSGRCDMECRADYYGIRESQCSSPRAVHSQCPLQPSQEPESLGGWNVTLAFHVTFLLQLCSKL